MNTGLSSAENRHDACSVGCVPQRAPHSLQRRRPSAITRGFTLIELMAVVIIVAVFATLAVPSVTKQLKGRRVAQAAQLAASLYTQARTRAMGRGSAVLVRYSNGRFFVREAQLGGLGGPGSCAALPSSTCLNTDWNTLANNEYRELPGLDLGNRGEYGTGADQVGFALKDAAGTTLTTLDVCFTPMGRVFSRTVTSSALVPLTAVHEIEASRVASRARRILLLPNGSTRLNL